MTVTRSRAGRQVSIAMKCRDRGRPAQRARRRARSFTLDGKDEPGARSGGFAARVQLTSGLQRWDGARLVLRTIHGLNNVREVWVLRGQRVEVAAGGPDTGRRRFGDARDLVYNKGS